MEGSTQAPIRHPIPWREDDFWDQLSLDDELRRVFDICPVAEDALIYAIVSLNFLI